MPSALGNNAPYLQSIKDSYKTPSEISSMDVVNPTDDLMKQIISDGFLQKMQEKYGPLPSGLMN